MERVIKLAVPHRLCLAGICLLALTVTARATGALSPRAQSAGQTTPAQTPAAPPQPPAPPPGYAGTDTCLVCHSDKEESLKGTAHSQAKNPRTPAATQGCESCHGPGRPTWTTRTKGNIRKFAADDAGRSQRDVPVLPQPGQSCRLGRQRARAPQSLVQHVPQRACAEVIRATAREENANGGLRDMPPRAGGQDRTRRRPHAGARGQDVLLVVPQPARVDQQRQGAQDRQLRCRALHQLPYGDARADAVGARARRENCATCHDPHGSSNDRMLVVRMPMLCQRCHVATRHPSSIYDKDEITTNKSNRMFGRSCVNCHSNVHGSNHPSGQFYMR